MKKPKQITADNYTFDLLFTEVNAKIKKIAKQNEKSTTSNSKHF